MDIHQLPVNGDVVNKVTTTKKSKAVGAFRVLLNFLHKPNSKKRNGYVSGASNENETTIDFHVKEAEVADSVRPPPEGGEYEGELEGEPSWNRHFNPQYCNGTVDIEEETVFPMTMATRPRFVENIDEEDVFLPQIKDDDDDYSPVKNNPNGGDKNVDDDVFLNGSYFEDDYIEDFSGSSSSSCSDYGSDVYRCCDKQEPLFDDAFYDCMDIFGSYNNLNIMAKVDKPYEKTIPDFTIPNNEVPKSFSEISNHSRQRSYSLPSDPLYTLCTNSEDYADSNRMKRLHSCVEYTDQRADSKAKNRDLLELNRVDSILADCSPFLEQPVYGDNVHSECRNPHVNSSSESIKLQKSEQMKPVLVMSRVNSSSATKGTVQPVDLQTHHTASSTGSVLRLEKQVESSPCERGQRETGLVYDEAVAALPLQSIPSSTETRSAPILPGKEEENEDIETDRRLLSQGSVESGYGTHRTSSTSSQSSHVERDEEMLLQELNAVESPSSGTATDKDGTAHAQRAFLDSPLSRQATNPALGNNERTPLPELDFKRVESPTALETPTKHMNPIQEREASSRGFTPLVSPLIPTTPATSLQRLHTGTPLSPDSRNTIDGIVDNNNYNNSKRGFTTPKRSLKPKFIFPSTATRIGSTCSDQLKPVPECVESPLPVLENKSRVTKYGLGNMDKKLKSDEIQRELYTSENATFFSSPVLQMSLDGKGEDAVKSKPIDINLNISVSIVDLSNDAKGSLINLNDNQQLTHSLCCFPPSPTQTPTVALQQTNSLTAKEELLTPIHQAATMTDHFNAMAITSPFGKTLRPICTSSPLPNKFAPSTRRISQTAPPNRTSLKNRFNQPVKIDCKLSPISTHAYQPDEHCKKRENVRRSNSDRRKKLVKRKSARACLNFGRDLNSLNDSDLMCPKDTNPSALRCSISGDYVTLKRVAESIVLLCPNRQLIHSWVDLPALMENLNSEYDKIMKSDSLVKSQRMTIHRISDLKDGIGESRNILSNLTVENCLGVLLMSLLVRDLERTTASLDFVFENLQRVLPKHSNLSHLAPEIVMMLLSNPRCIVNNNHGFPLPYPQSEREVFKALVKYVEAIQKRNKGTTPSSVIVRVKNLLSIVADSRVLTATNNTSSADKRLLKESPLPCNNRFFFSSSSLPGMSKRSDGFRDAFNILPPLPPPPPRPSHVMLFTKSQPTLLEKNLEREYMFQPFISSEIQSLDEIEIAKGSSMDVASSPSVSMDQITNDRYVLRKLYFSYRRCAKSDFPYITKIGMQYSHRGKKTTVFIAKARLNSDNCSAIKPDSSKYEKNPLSRNGRSCGDPDTKSSDFWSRLDNESNDNGHQKVSLVPLTNSSTTTVTEGTSLLQVHPRQDNTTIKKAAVILKAGEHITAVSILGEQALHNMEIVTNRGRRIRAHGLQNVPSDAKWVAIATPNGNGVSCLHALFGDVYKSSAGRSYIRDIGALWISTSLNSMNDLG